MTISPPKYSRPRRPWPLLKRPLVNNQKQKQLQDARIVEAEDGVRTAEANISAAQAGIEAANASITGARGGIEAIQANVTRTAKERKRQEALIATESTTPQKLEQAVADDETYRSQLAIRNADLATANAQLSSRQADLARARAQLTSAQSEVEAQRRQRAVLDSQELQLHAAVEVQKAALSLTKTNLGYTKIVAPEDGIVSERLVRPGQLVSPGTQVISLVQNDVWVQANFLENQIRGIQRGDVAEIRVDAIPGAASAGTGRGSGSGQRIAVCALTAGQCDGELHENCAAYSGKDCSGSRSINGRSFAPRSLSDSPGPHERLPFMIA